MQCKVAKIDADSERDIGTKYDISGFPTIKFFPAGDDKEPVLYEGQRSEAGFIEYLNKQCGTHRVVGGGLDAKVKTNNFCFLFLLCVYILEVLVVVSIFERNNKGSLIKINRLVVFQTWTSQPFNSFLLQINNNVKR